ncbi:MAG: hypothetical protein KF861_24455, partial [Planctomycetaceae bacterium]|nr:hypothetical protein [Planctomycetaceae bacterium]
PPGLQSASIAKCRMAATLLLLISVVTSAFDSAGVNRMKFVCFSDVRHDRGGTGEDQEGTLRKSQGLTFFQSGGR